jgi:hypothetical protein
MLLACGMLLFSGCAPAGPLSTDPVIAVRQASELIPKGTPKARATKLLQKRGFEFSRFKSEPGAGTDHLLIATCTKQKYTWLVGLVIIDGRVVASSVTVSKES